MERLEIDKRSIRRHHSERMKARVRRVVRTWPGGESLAQDPRFVGIEAGVRLRRCSCKSCTLEYRPEPVESEAVRWPSKDRYGLWCRKRHIEIGRALRKKNPEWTGADLHQYLVSSSYYPDHEAVHVGFKGLDESARIYATFVTLTCILT